MGVSLVTVAVVMGHWPWKCGSVDIGSGLGLWKWNRHVSGYHCDGVMELGFMTGIWNMGHGIWNIWTSGLWENGICTLCTSVHYGPWTHCTLWTFDLLYIKGLGLYSMDLGLNVSDSSFVELHIFLDWTLWDCTGKWISFVLQFLLILSCFLL